MAYVRVDVELDEFDTDDILYEAIEILKNSPRGRKDYKKKLNRLINEVTGESAKTRSLLDQLKADLFEQNIHNKTLEEFERFFNGG